MKKKMSMSQWVAMSQMMKEDEDEDNEEEGEVEDGEEESVVEEIKTTGQKGGKFTGHYDDLEGGESITEHYAHNNEEDFVDENGCVKTTIDLKKKIQEADIDVFFILQKFFLIGENTIQKKMSMNKTTNKRVVKTTW